MLGEMSVRVSGRSLCVPPREVNVIADTWQGHCQPTHLTQGERNARFRR